MNSPPTCEGTLKTALKAEREEGEISDDFEDISSDEEITMRQRIEQLEARNIEFAEIAYISTKSYDADIFSDFVESPSHKLPAKRKKVKSVKSNSIRSTEVIDHKNPKRRKVRSKILESPIKSTKKRTSSHKNASKRHQSKSAKSSKLEKEVYKSRIFRLASPISSSDEDEFYLNRNELKEALRRDGRDNLLTRTTLKMKLKDAVLQQMPKSPDKTEQINDSDNDSTDSFEEKRLRLIALQSKLKKPFTLERPYSPTDNVFDIGEMPSERGCEDYIQDSVNMEISPLGSPGFEDQILLPIDMDIASESDQEVQIMPFNPPLPLETVAFRDKLPLPPLPSNQPNSSLFPMLPDIDIAADALSLDLNIIDTPKCGQVKQLPTEDIEDEETEALRAVLLSRPKLKVKNCDVPDNIPVSSNLKEALKRYKKRSFSLTAVENNDAKENIKINCNDAKHDDLLTQHVIQKKTKSVEDEAVGLKNLIGTKDETTQQVPPKTIIPVLTSNLPIASDESKEVAASKKTAIHNLTITALKLRQKRAAELFKRRPKISQDQTKVAQTVNKTTLSVSKKILSQTIDVVTQNNQTTTTTTNATDLFIDKTANQFLVKRPLTPTQSKSLTTVEAKPVKKLIIRIGESESDSEDAASWNQRVHVSSVKPQLAISSTKEFELKVEEFLKSARSKAQKEQKVAVRSPVKTLTPLAVSHLPPSSQLEYNRLIKRMKQLEKQRQTRVKKSQNASVAVTKVMKPSNPTETIAPNPQVPIKDRLDTSLLVSIKNNDESSVTRRIDINKNNTSMEKDTVEIAADFNGQIAGKKNVVSKDETQKLTPPIVAIPEQILPLENISSPSTSTSNTKTKLLPSRMSPEETRKRWLEKVEKEYLSHGKMLIEDLNLILGVVRTAQEERQRQSNLESELDEMRQQMLLKEKELNKQKALVVQLYPKISHSHQSILKKRDIFTSFNRKCCLIGQKLKGPSYKLPSKCKDQIVAKLRLLSLETKKLKLIKTGSKKTDITQKCPEKAGTPIKSDEVLISDKVECQEKILFESKDCQMDSTNYILHDNSSDSHKSSCDTETVVTEDSNETKTKELSKSPTKEDPARTLVQIPRYISPLEHMNTGSSSRPTDPDSIICPYQLNGQCEDKECLYQHLL